MIRIRLRRIGRGNQTYFRVVAIDKDKEPGRFVEILGFYNPKTQPATIQLKEERIYDWIGKGAQPSDSAMQVFKVSGLTGRYERFKKGERVEALLAEAESTASTRKANYQIWYEAEAAAPVAVAASPDTPIPPQITSFREFLELKYIDPLHILKVSSILAQDYVNLMAILFFIDRISPSKIELVSFIRQINSNPFVTLRSLFDAKLISQTNDSINITPLGGHIVKKLMSSEEIGLSFPGQILKAAGIQAMTTQGKIEEYDSEE